MAYNTGEVGVFLELRKRLQSGLLVLGTEVAGSPAEVRVTGGERSLQVQTARGLLCLKLPTGVSVAEGSCLQTPAPPGEELHFRLRIKVDRCIDQEPHEGVLEGLRVQENFSFTCQACGTRLLQDRVFQRVLPLPNGNWNSLVDDWCCHPDPFANLKLLPRPGDCLLGDTYFLLARDSECGDTLTQEVQEVSPAHTEDGDGQDPKKPCRRRTLISCKSCLSGLGEAVTPDTLKLYITEVEVNQSDADSERDRHGDSPLNIQTVGRGDPPLDRSRGVFLERTLAARLLSLSTSQSMFRFSLQAPDQQACLLLWLLNSDSVVACVSEQTVMADLPVSPSLRLSAQSQSHAAVSVLKLLYIACSDQGNDSTQRELIAEWERTVSVHPLDLPLTSCLEVLQVLKASTSCLPPSLRRCDAYQVAYLRL